MKPTGGLFSVASITTLIIFAVVLPGCQVTKVTDKIMWPEEIKKIDYLSLADSSMQPSLFYAPKRTKEPAALLVGLHTWSGAYTQKLSMPYGKWCIENGWVFIHPHFRGPNRTKEATGSELVVGDILSAVEYAKKQANVDTSRIYLLGASGGGYTALLMAGRAPDVWAGVSAWVPITNLKDWYNECRELKCSHADDIVKSCGGEPGTSAAVELEYVKRSPVTYLKGAVGVSLDINAGIRDGHHSGGVPINHALRGFNVVVSPKDRISEEDITYFVEEIQVPQHLMQELSDPTYGAKQPLFRRTSGQARVTIFDGGHDIIYKAALTWLSKQKKEAVK